MNVETSIPIAAPIPAASAAPAAPVAMPATTPLPAAPTPMAEGGPILPKPATHFFEGITLLDIGMIALVSMAMFYSIYASRQTIAYIRNRQQLLSTPSPVPVAIAPVASPAAAST